MIEKNLHVLVKLNVEYGYKKDISEETKRHNQQALAQQMLDEFNENLQAIKYAFDLTELRIELSQVISDDSMIRRMNDTSREYYVFVFSIKMDKEINEDEFLKYIKGYFNNQYLEFKDEQINSEKSEPAEHYYYYNYDYKFTMESVENEKLEFPGFRA